MSVNRINRINEEFRKELSDIIRNLKDPRIPLMTSVVTVNVTPDLRYAKIYISILGSEEEQKAAMAALKNSTGYVRREMGARLKMRYTPEPVFELDHSIEHGARISELLKSTQGD
ncbi:MAG: 30S ribosome-binding factor RbfA [Ruminococcaceae bacterium]|nr:30S ribosome-binding factor RbfA [Oscillospiraceae bacterium]